MMVSVFTEGYLTVNTVMLTLVLTFVRWPTVTVTLTVTKRVMFFIVKDRRWKTKALTFKATDFVHFIRVYSLSGERCSPLA